MTPMEREEVLQDAAESLSHYPLSFAPTGAIVIPLGDMARVVVDYRRPEVWLDSGWAISNQRYDAGEWITTGTHSGIAGERLVGEVAKHVHGEVAKHVH